MSDNRLATKLCGWKPAIGLDQGLGDCATFVKESSTLFHPQEYQRWIEPSFKAGGKGTRLLPYTSVLPKPLMPIGDHPVLEIVIRQLVHFGFANVTIAVGLSLGHLIEAVIGDGSRWGANINYLREDEPRGTMGSLSQLESPDEPMLVMNGDLLTDIDYSELFEAHVRSGADLTVGVYSKRVPISLGVLDDWRRPTDHRFSREAGAGLSVQHGHLRSGTRIDPPHPRFGHLRVR